MAQKTVIWNQKQAALRQALAHPESIEQIIALFLQQHTPLHSAQVTLGTGWSYADEILADLDETLWRRIPNNKEHSIAWCIWHIARIEDVTMNLLMDGRPQLFTTEGWREKLRIYATDIGNETGMEAEISAAIDLHALRDYRDAVGRRTRELVSQLTPERITEKVHPERLQEALNVGAISPRAQNIINYWGGLTVAGLLLMPPTRHNLVHLNEAARLKKIRA